MSVGENIITASYGETAVPVLQLSVLCVRLANSGNGSGILSLFHIFRPQNGEKQARGSRDKETGTREKEARTRREEEGASGGRRRQERTSWV